MKLPLPARWLGGVFAVAALAATTRLMPADGRTAFATVPAAAVDTVPAGAAVTIDNFTFTPASLTIAAGTRVVWTNRDDIPHTVTSAGEPRILRSPPLDTDDRFSFTFATPGTYRYFCSLHPHMQGIVVVR